MAESQMKPIAVRPGVASRVSAKLLLQAAIHLVFGLPFLCCLLAAVLGSEWWASHGPHQGAAAGKAGSPWPIAAATGSLWLGVFLLLAGERGRRAAGLVLTLAGCALLLAWHP